MAYLEKLLPEFRKGAKIRRKIWSDKVFMSSENIGESCLCARDIDANDWELWQEPKEDIDWDIDAAISNIIGGAWFENELTEYIRGYARVEEKEEDEELLQCEKNS